MKKRRIGFFDIVLICGMLLVAGAAALSIFSHLQRENGAEASAEILSELRDVMPEPHDEMPDRRSNVTMPAIEIGGESFCGIIELPAYGTELPVHEIWSPDVTSHPRKFCGSIYDGTLVIGGSDSQGQFDFVNSILNEDTVLVTDVTGGRYAYSVTEIVRSRDVSADYLISGDGDLVIFAKNTYSLDYTVIRCKIG